MSKASVEWLPVRSLTCDSRVQRGLIGARVRHLEAQFDPDALGIFTVSIRGENGSCEVHTIDGNHRREAAMRLGRGEMKVKCHIYRNLSLAEEAQMFLDLNDSRAVSPIDKFDKGLVAQNEECLAIQDVLNRFGLRVAAGQGNGTIACIDRARTLHREGLLEDVLRVSIGAWGVRSEAVEHVVLASLGLLMRAYGEDLDHKSLTARLAKYTGGPAGLIGNARALSGMKPISVTRAAAEIIRDAYNMRRRGAALPPL